ncbi:MAG: aminotransferase class I/II-fold pyridoxal phosphate-dependent enzyme [Lachnospiraceae bacterium]|nr:aminotransferase class I/II-fold pyridoxal phosphate-dependent enzyme [Lachnospiraceae bacterium]
MKFNTLLLHGAYQGDKDTGATWTPIYQSSAFAHQSAEQLEKIFHNQAPGYSYTRINNPTIDAFEKRVTAIEGGIASVACASGMAALFNAFSNILRSGDEIVSSASLYGGSIDLFRDLEAFGIKTHYVENNNLEAFQAATNEHTRLYFAETLGNPCLDVTDIRPLADLAHKNGLPLIIDNTVTTAYLVQPISLGADIVVNSSSKYINGNSNSISGVLTDSGKFKWNTVKYPGMTDYVKFGPFAYTAKLRNGLFRNTGACLSPQNAFYNSLGMESLGLRMERISDNALKLATFLQEKYPQMTVNYPGLASSRWHEIAKRQFNGHYGGMVTVRTGSKEKAFAIINGLRVPLNVSNIGDTKTLVIHPESTISVHSTEEEKRAAGVFDDLIRISVGIEDIDDLIDDFEQAIQKSDEKN